jgi:hypothetical protein
MSDYLCDECYEEPANSYHDKIGACCKTCLRKVRMEGIKALDRHESPQYDWMPWQTGSVWGDGIPDVTW